MKKRLLSIFIALMVITACSASVWAAAPEGTPAVPVAGDSITTPLGEGEAPADETGELIIDNAAPAGGSDASAEEMDTADDTGSENNEEENEPFSLARGNSLYDPLPENAQAVQDIWDAFLLNPDSSPLPKWEFPVDPSWLPSGVVQSSFAFAPEEPTVVFWQLHTDSSNQIISIADFLQKLATANNNDIFYLTDAFADELEANDGLSITLPPGVENITIDGRYITRPFYVKNGRHFQVNAPGAGVTLRSIIFDGSNPNSTSGVKGGVNVSSNSNLTLEHCVFTNIHSASAGNGGVMSIGSNVDLIATNTSFVNNSENWGNHSGGAIATTRANGTSLSFFNCYFSQNVAPLGSNSGRGGAIAVQQPRGTGNRLLIENCYFEENSTRNASGENRTTADGGAVSVFIDDANTSFELIVKNSTFYNNSAADDGAAIFMEGQNNSTQTAYITNSTFAENKSRSVPFLPDSGGAIQFSLNCTAYLESNTFYGNTKTGANGAAVGVHIDPADATRAPAVGLRNNLFVGNTASSSAYNNVALEHRGTLGFGKLLSATILYNDNNVGYDNGTALPAGYTTPYIFGASSPLLAANGREIFAGTGEYKKAVSTLYPTPRHKTSPIHPDGSAMPTDIVTDQRGLPRQETLPDAGAVEIVWAEFDANGGSWALPEMPEYRYGLPFCIDNDGNISQTPTRTFVVTDFSGSYVAVDSPQPPTRDTYFFGGWTTTPNDESTLTTTFLNSETTYYALWRTSPIPSITYHYNHPSATIPAQTDTHPSGSAVIKELAALGTGGWPIPGQTLFTGWNTLPAGDGISYSAGVTLPLEGEVNLYAQWAPVTYTVLFDAQGGSDVAPYTGVEYDSTIAPPAPPTRNGFTFSGWHKDKACTQKWVFESDSVVQNITLYALWLPLDQPQQHYTVTYLAGGTDVTGTPPVDSTLYLSGETVVVLEPGSSLSKNGFTFAGWQSSADGKVYTAGQSFIITGNVTLTALWTQTPPSSSSEVPNSGSQSGGSSAVATGDIINLLLPLALLVASLGIVAIVVVIRKRDKKDAKK